MTEIEDRNKLNAIPQDINIKQIETEQIYKSEETKEENNLIRVDSKFQSFKKANIKKHNKINIVLDDTDDIKEKQDKTETSDEKIKRISDKIKTQLYFSEIPKDIEISTMTMTCATKAKFNLRNIGYYFGLIPQKIMSIKYGLEDDTNRSLYKKHKKRVSEKKKKKNNFYNSVSIEVMSREKKVINIKIFLNGSIQMTGCKDIYNSIDALHILFVELSKTRGVYNTSTRKIEDVTFLIKTDPSTLIIDNLLNIKIAMINSNYDIGFEIDRDKLFGLVQTYNASFDPNLHAGVIIKYDSNGKIVSIFVFESGAIIITGANNGKQINEAYTFISKLLLNNYKYINKLDLLSNSAILMFLSSNK